jgi:hypothetical protein
MLYGTLFMMAGAYTLATERTCPRRRALRLLQAAHQATLDLILYFVFFIPGVLALCWAGWDFASESWVINEHSSVTADGPPIYPFKMVHSAGRRRAAAAGRGGNRALRDLHPQGEWPSRTMTWRKSTSKSCKEMVHVDEDIGRRQIRAGLEHAHE